MPPEPAFRLVLLGLILIAFGQPAFAGDRISQRAVFEDSTARLDFEMIQRQAFTPYSGILSRGYGHSALWVRLRIDPEPGDADTSLVLRIRPGYLDEVQLYDSVYHSLGVEITGDRYPIAQDHYHSLNANLSVPGGNAPRDIWLRIESTSSRLFQVQALGLEEALQRDREQEIPYSLYLAFLTLTLLWAAAHWLMRRARVLLLFTLKQTAGLIYMTGYLGYARVLWPASLTGINAGQLTDWTLPLYATLGCLFDYTLLRASRAHPLGLKILLGLTALLLLEYVPLLLDRPREAFLLNAVVVLVGICLTPLLAWTTPPRSELPVGEWPPLSRRDLILLYLVIFLSFIPSVLPVLGIGQAGLLVFDGFLIHGMASSVAMWLAMVRQTRESERRLMGAEAARECAERRASAEEQHRQEQAQFLTMLTHELKTPLSVVRMVLGAREPTDDMKWDAECSIRDMTHIIQRCTQVEKLGDSASRSQRIACGLAEELVDIIRGSAQPDRITLCTDDLPVIETDPLLLRMIIANLVDNACKYSEEPSPITLRLTAPVTVGRRQWCLSVANRPGKAGHPDPERVFEKFYRAPRAHEITGSGLGLFLAARLAEQLGGELRYRPSDTEVIFELWVPA